MPGGEAEEMAQRVRVLAEQHEDLSSHPSSRVKLARCLCL